MTTTTVHAGTPVPATEEVPAESSAITRRHPLRTVGGLALIAVTPLFVAAGLTSPPQASNSSADYVASLAADPARTGLSAQLYHYGWLGLIVGAIGILLFVGSRGRVFTSVAVLTAVVGATQINSLLLADYFNASAGRTLSSAQAVGVFDDVFASPGVAIWRFTGMLALLSIPLLVAGLARAGRVSWWMLALPVVGFVVPFVLPAASVLAGLAGGVGFLPLAWVGVLLIRRASA